MLMYLETATAISYRNIFLLLLLRGVNFLTLKTYLHASVQVGIITCQCFLQRLRFCCEIFFFFFEMFGRHIGMSQPCVMLEENISSPTCKPSPSNVCALLPLKTLKHGAVEAWGGGDANLCACNVFSTWTGMWVITF